MDDFFVFGDSYEKCVNNLEAVLLLLEETNLGAVTLVKYFLPIIICKLVAYLYRTLIVKLPFPCYPNGMQSATLLQEHNKLVCSKFTNLIELQIAKDKFLYY